MIAAKIPSTTAGGIVGIIDATNAAEIAIKNPLPSRIAKKKISAVK